MQTDRRWRDKPYQVPGERATIGGSGCGPACAAMVIETLTGQTCTPEDTCKWSVDHGYKARGQGTYYSYFVPQLAAFGITCWQLSWTSGYHSPKAKVHDQALEYLRQGYYLIALMKAGMAWALMQGRNYVIPDDIQALAVPVLAHRIQLNRRAQDERDSEAGIVEKIISSLAVPQVS